MQKLSRALSCGCYYQSIICMEFEQCLMSAQKNLYILWCKILDLLYTVYASGSYCELHWAWLFVSVCPLQRTWKILFKIHKNDWWPPKTWKANTSIVSCSEKRKILASVVQEPQTKWCVNRDRVVDVQLVSQGSPVSAAFWGLAPWVTADFRSQSWLSSGSSQVILCSRKRKAGPCNFHSCF